MKIVRQINIYCPYCNAHTLHTLKPSQRSKQRGLGKATRRHNRAIKGYIGSVELKIHPKKLGKRQKVTLECTKCKKSVERVFGGRTKKKIEIKAR